jgi:hypothetical protein
LGTCPSCKYGRHNIIFSLFSSQFTADKTIKITIRSCINPDEFVTSNLINCANFVIETCPNLTTLYFDICTLLPVGGNANDYVDKLNTILSSLMNEFLKPLDKGHSELKICLTLHGYCYCFVVRKGWKLDDVRIYNNNHFSGYSTRS